MRDDPPAPPLPPSPAPGASPPAPPSDRQTATRRRDDRRAAALKANMARRKAQVRGRQQASDPGPDGHPAPATRTE